MALGLDILHPSLEPLGVRGRVLAGQTLLWAWEWWPKGLGVGWGGGLLLGAHPRP